MDLLARYLQAVRFFLPRRQQDDIVGELSENLISQMEDRQEELGRPLTDDEQADILRRHGHPMLVAGRYGAHQQLIGPAFFSIYLFALKIGLAAALTLTVLLALVTSILSGDPVHRVVQELLAFPGRALMVFAWTTVSFAALDLLQSRLKLPRTWDPRTLPKVARQEDRMSRFASLAELLFTAAGGVWLLLVPSTHFLVLGPAVEFLDLAPIWSVAYLPMLALTAATLVLAWVNLARPFWTPARSWTRLVLHVATFLLAAFLLRAGVWVVAREGLAPPDGSSLTRIVDLVNASVQIGLFFTGLVSLIEIGRDVRRLRTRRNQSSPSGSAPAGAVGC